MKFKLFFVSILFWVNYTFAENYMMIAFGIDGSTGKPIPVNNSHFHSKQVFWKLDIPTVNNGSIKKVSMNDLFEVEAKESSVAIGLNLKKHIVRSRIKGQTITFIPTSYGDVYFAGKGAEILFKKLMVSPVIVSSTMISKTVGNLKCDFLNDYSKLYSCALTDVSFFSM